MRPLLLLAALSLFCACPSGTPQTPPNDAGTPPAGAVETPSTSLPAELKPPIAEGAQAPALPGDLKPPDR